MTRTALSGCLLVATLLPTAELRGQEPAGLDTLSPAAEQIRQRLEQLREGGQIEVAGRTIGGGSVFDFYEEYDFEPTWSAEAGAQLSRFIGSIDLDGLDPADYAYDALVAAARDDVVTPSGLAERDLLLTDVLVSVAHDLRRGRVDPTSLGPQWKDTPRAPPVPVDSLRALVEEGEVMRGLARLRPSHFIYQGLVGALASYRAIEERGGWPGIGPGPLLALDSVSPRLPNLRLRLLRTGDLAPGTDSTSMRFDAEVEAGVVRFQHRHGLNDDGIVGRATVAALDVPVARRIRQLRTNLERARWVAHGLAAEFVAVNIAGQRVYFMRDGAIAWETRAVVGLPYRQTPVFRDSLRYLVVNPTWTVPRSINSEILASIRRDPTYLRTQGFDVIDAAGRTVDTSGIDFTAYTGATFPWVFRQRGGPTNALGRIKFMFPNSYHVYLHDTPARALFEREQRTFSHGCIRVQDPFRLAELLLEPQGGPDRAGLAALVASGETRSLDLAVPVPVLILYWTASTDLHGEVHFYPDVYDRDASVERALFGSGNP